MNVKQGEGLRFYGKPDGKAAVIAVSHELPPEVPDRTTTCGCSLGACSNEQLADSMASELSGVAGRSPED
jgi:nitrate reductase NapA